MIVGIVVLWRPNAGSTGWVASPFHGEDLCGLRRQFTETLGIGSYSLHPFNLTPFFSGIK